MNRVPMGVLGAQADLLRVPLADGTLIATPEVPSDDLVPQPAVGVRRPGHRLVRRHGRAGGPGQHRGRGR